MENLSFWKVLHELLIEQFLIKQMKYCLSLVFGFIISCALSAQDPVFILDQQKASPGDSVRLCIVVNNFQDIISLQFTLDWNPEILQFLGTSNYGLPGLSELNYNQTQAGNGKLPFVWFDNSGDGLNLPDSSRLFCLYFMALGEIGDASLIEFSNDPTPIQIGQLDGNQVSEISFSLLEGMVEIVENVLSLSVQGTDILCFGESLGSIQLEIGGGILPYRFNWTGPNGFSSSAQNLSDLGAGTYQVSVRDSIGRSSDTSIVIRQADSALSVDNINPSPAECQQNDGAVNLQVSGGAAPYQFELNGQTNTTGIFSDLAPGDYLAMITDAQLCQTEAMFSIESGAGETAFDLGPDRILCPGDTILLNAPPGFINYQWFLNNSPVASITNLKISSAGTYSLQAETNVGCVLNDQLEVNFSILEGFASGDTELEPGDSTQLIATDGSDYQWSPASNLSCSTCANPVAAPELSTTYLVLFKTLDGCLVSDSVSIEVIIPENELRFEPVTFISPNGDGKNDALLFPGLETYQSNEIKVFSRWGQLVYSKVNYQIQGELWDGSIRGKPLPAGVYYYILRVDEQNLSVKRNLTIVR